MNGEQETQKELKVVKEQVSEEIKDTDVVAETVTEEKFTLEQAAEELKAKQAKIIEDRKARMERFNELIQGAMKETGCTLQVDPSSPLDNLRIIVVSAT